MEVDLQPVLLLLGTLTPFLTAIAAKVETPDWWKGLLSLTWAAIAAVVTNYVNHGGDWNNFFPDLLQVWSIHLMTWLGITRQMVSDLNEKTAKFGLPFLPEK